MKINVFGLLLLGIITTMFIISCDDSSSEPENKFPICEFITPLDQDTIQLGDTVTINVEANDLDGNIVEVRFYINGIGISSSTTFPFKYQWITKNEDPDTYTIKAVAKDSEGASTEAEIEILLVNYIEREDLVDLDGNTYKTVKIGNQIWMAENLKVSQDAYGVPLTNVTDNQAWSELSYNDKAFCYYLNSISNATEYGALYTYTSASESCPEGWHLPTAEEWEELISFVASYGHENEAGTVLKSIDLWYGVGGSDIYGFSAKPGGKRTTSGNFYNISFTGTWWASSLSQGTSTYYDSYVMESYDYDVNKNPYTRVNNGLSVRCIKD